MADISKQVKECIQEGHIKQVGDKLELVPLAPKTRAELRASSRKTLIDSLNNGDDPETALKKATEFEKLPAKRHDFCELVLGGPVIDRVASGEISSSWMNKFSAGSTLVQLAMLKEYVNKFEPLEGCDLSSTTWSAGLNVSQRTGGTSTITKVGITCGSQTVDILMDADPSTNRYQFISRNSNRK